MIKIKDLVLLLEENKLKSISVYDLTSNEEEKFVVICSAASTVASKKAADAIDAKFSYTDKIEGYSKGEWIVFDFDKITLHIFLPKLREKYNLDKLYKPKKIVLE